MPTKKSNHRSNSTNFYSKHVAEIWILSIGVMAIVLFLSASFYWFDATNIEGPNRSIRRVDRKAKSEELIASHESEIFIDHAAGLVNGVIRWSSDFAVSSMTFGAVVSPDNSMWRYTNDGWKDISLMAEQGPTTEPLLESVHPWIWTALMLFGVLLMLVMASSEKEVRKLMGHEPELADRPTK
jgi:hypothetical protein